MTPTLAPPPAGHGGLRVFSYGGGWQSTAALALAARGRLDYRVFLFANVGDDSEDPATLAYIRQHAAPFAAAAGIELHELSRARRDGSTETLYGRLTRDGSRSLPIPVRMSNGAPGTRSCTADFKIRVIGRWLKAHGASADTPATVGIGISLDEIHRASTRRAEPYEHITYPLIGLPADADTGLRIRRDGCPAIIRAAGLPVPPKSACWFCPLHQFGRWADLKRQRPALFERACALEDTLNTRRDQLGKARVYLSRYGTPLRQVVPATRVLFDSDSSDGDGGCDSGWCFT
jgi:hypothetical protein